MNSLILKLDLVKAYNRVNWDFPRLVLFKVGMSLEVTNWVMGCVSSPNFSILLNGESTWFFKCYIGLLQWCPLSTLLFLFIVDSLSRLILIAKREGSLKGIKLTHIIRITYLLFVDDIILFGEGYIVEWLSWKSIMDSFCKATCMLISDRKSTFLDQGMESDVLLQVKSLFPFQVKSLNSGFKYVGYFLKPNN